MAISANKGLRDVAVLSSAVEAVFRKLIRMLIGKMSLKKLQEMIQVIFVEETEAKLREASPGKNVALGTIALQTGVDTRTINKIRKQIAVSDPIHKDDRFLDGFMPLFKVFDLWMNDEMYFDSARAKPRLLAIDGDGATFSSLVKSSIHSRGLTTPAVLKRLQELDVVAVDSDAGTVKLTQENNVFISKDELDLLDVGFTAIANLASTVEHNIRHAFDEDAKYFQRGSWDYQFSHEKIAGVRKVIHNYLREVDDKSRVLIRSLSEEGGQEGQMTAGISMFYFEEDATVA